MLGIDPLLILIALICGIASRAVGFPALIGYLVAGFVLHETDFKPGPLLAALSELGITLMLFTIGLKLEPRKLLETQVWGTTIAHMLVTQALVFIVLFAFNELIPGLSLDLRGIAIVAFALTFSSTVFVIQTMQERGESSSSHAGLAIGILIVQDLVAVGFLAIAAGKVPHIEALLLLLIIPLRPLILWTLKVVGYGELLTLCGLTLAIGSAQASEAVGVKGDLGALIVGAVLAGHPKSKAMASNLMQLKDLFLIGFFLSIGLAGWPSLTLVIFAVMIGIGAIFKPPLYFWLMTRFHTSPRTAVLAAGSLGNHSEFGLIVIAVAATAQWVDPQWTAALSIGIAISFVVAAPINGATHGFYQRHRERLLSFRSDKLLESYEPTDNVKIVILGMGRVGTGAYESLARHSGKQLLGVESTEARVAAHRSEQRRIVCADASDPDFWHRVDLQEVQLIMLALTNHPENMLVAQLLRSMGYQGAMAAVVRHTEHAEEMAANGISAFNLYGQAGAGFAAHAADLVANAANHSRTPSQ